MLLELAGYDVTLALTGTAGVEAARTTRPELVVCDIGLPGLDGYQVAATLRRAPETCKARLIALTAYGQPEDVEKAYRAGFNLHLTKPVDPRVLLDRLACDVLD